MSKGAARIKGGAQRKGRRTLTGLQISRVLFYACAFLFLWPQDGFQAQEIPDHPGKALVKSEPLIVYAEASLASIAVGTLHRGEAVTVKIEIFGAGEGGPWCGIAPPGEGRGSGYVQCAHLARGAESRQEWQLLAVPGPSQAAGVTRAIIRGNQVIVPVLLSNGWVKEEARLLLDTGASTTVISSEFASRLRFNLDKAEKSLARVADGSLVDTLVVDLDALEVGPHTRSNLKIIIIERKGPVEEHDGLLGMDFLRDLHYRLDFENKQIIWQ
jgi:clan AA aspartic protease (TIGR02281 family)